MNSSIRNRLLTILFVFGLGIYALLPSVRYAMMDDESISNLSSEQKDYFESRSLKQGLDLKGGMYIVLEADIPTLMMNLAKPRDPLIEKTISNAKENSPEEFV